MPLTWRVGAGLLVATVASSSCAHMASRVNGFGLQRTTPAVETDAFAPAITVSGIDHYLPRGMIGKDYLRTIIPRDRRLPVFHQLYVAHQYSGDWKFWNRANGQGADMLEFVPIARDVGTCYASTYDDSCTLREIFGVMIPDSTLRAHANGYAVKVYAKDGDSVVLTLDSTQIQSQLRTVDSISARRGSTRSNPAIK